MTIYQGKGCKFVSLCILLGVTLEFYAPSEKDLKV
jgi:hypothetical protein